MRSFTLARFAQIFLSIGLCALFFQSMGCKKNTPIPTTNQATAATAPLNATTKPEPAIAMDAQAVDRALARAIKFLHESRRDGQWGENDSENPTIGRESALVLRALMQAGEGPQDPRVQYPLAQYMKGNLISTQAIADRLRVSVLLGPSYRDRNRIKNDANALYSSMMVKEGETGFHPRTLKSSEVSLSASAQASRALAEVPREDIGFNYWKQSESAWHRLLKDELDKNISDKSEAVSAATELMPLLRAVDMAGTTGEQLQLLSADGKPVPPDALFDSALKELSRRYTGLYRAPGEFEAMEVFARVMRSRGIRLVGGHDWYRDGVAFLMAAQKADGSWGDGARDTAHAILFLSRARAPVIFQKLQYATDGREGAPAPWNNRPYDLAHLTDWLSEQLEGRFDWQVLSIDAPMEEWFRVPILYISGNAALDFNAEHRAKLKQYIEQGGLILGNPDGGDARFIQSFMKLGQAMFPMYEFRELPADHIIYGSFFKRTNLGARPSFRGLSNGVRELMLYFPTDAGRGWQLEQAKAAKALPFAQLAANIVAYKTENKFKFKEEFFQPQGFPDFAVAAASAADIRRPPRPEVDASDLLPDNFMPAPKPPIKSVTLAMISSSADPAGLPRFESLRAALQRNDTQLNIDPLVLGKWTLQRYDTACITPAQFTALGSLQRLEIKRFIETGGTLLIDASAKVAQAAAATAEAQLAKLFTDPKLIFSDPTPDDAALFSAAPKSSRVARFGGRIAVLINTHPDQAEAILQSLLANRAK